MSQQTAGPGTAVDLAHNGAVEVSSAIPRDKHDLLKRTVAKGTDDDEFELFVAVCNRTGLDPFARQVYAVSRWDRRAGRNVMGIQTSIDGLRLIANRHGDYAGQKPPQWCDADGVWRDVWLEKDAPAGARVAVLRHSFAEPLVAVATWTEYAQLNKEGKPAVMWAKMPALMLSKCAEGLALRKAFPAEMSGVYTAEEMTQATRETSPPPEGFVSWDEAHAAHQALTARIKGLPPDVDRAPFEALRVEHGWPMAAARLAELERMAIDADPNAEEPEPATPSDFAAETPADDEGPSANADDEPLDVETVVHEDA